MTRTPDSRRGKPLRRNRLPHAGTTLVPFCRDVARALAKMTDFQRDERRVVERFLARLDEADAADGAHRRARTQTLMLGARAQAKRAELLEALQRVDFMACARHGRRSPELLRYALRPHKKRGRKGPRRGRAPAGPDK